MMVAVVMMVTVGEMLLAYYKVSLLGVNLTLRR